MSKSRNYGPFTLLIGAPKDSITKYAAHPWDYDPDTQVLSYRLLDDARPGRDIALMSFARLVIGEDVRAIAADGSEVRLGVLKGFAVNEEGAKVPRVLAPQRA